VILLNNTQLNTTHKQLEQIAETKKEPLTKTTFNEKENKK
jgi:hypothetical protein